MSGADLLSGLRVLDFSRVMAGPFCTALLADLGAEVIKVEPLGGDDYRHIGPFKDGESALFLLMNRNKRGLTLNLKSQRGVALAQALAAQCDVVVENFKPGVARRLGIDHETLAAGNPRLVYASISGFGQRGPLADRPAYDLIAQAMAGMMSVTGDPEGPPTRTGESIADLSAGLYAAWAITAALFARERSGRGRRIDVAMFDSVFSLLPTALGQFLYGGMTPQRTGNRHPLSSPFGSFRAADGEVIIAVANDALFGRLAQAMDAPGLARDPRFASDELRTRNEPALRAAIEAWTGRLTVTEVVAVLDAHGVPGSPIWTVAQAAESAQVAFRQLLGTARHPRLGEIALIEQPVHFSDAPRGGHAPAPLLGEHSETVLGELLGIDRADIEALRREGVI